jgi:hypothetical protein
MDIFWPQIYVRETNTTVAEPQSFLTANRKAHYSTRSWATFLYVPPSELTFLGSIWTLSVHLLPRLRSRYFPRRFLARSPHLPDPSHMPIPSQRSRSRGRKVTTVTGRPTNLLVMLVLNCSLAPPLRCSNIFLSSVRSEACNLCCSFRDHVSYSYRTNWNDQNTKVDVRFPVAMAWLWRLIAPGTWCHTVCCYTFTEMSEKRTCPPSTIFMLWRIDP